MGTICQHMRKTMGQEGFAADLESFSELMDTLLEKHEDKYDQAKYVPLLKELMTKTDYFIFLVEELDSKPTPRAQQLLLRTVETYLKIFLPVKQEKVGWEEPTNYPPPPLDEAMLKSLKAFLMAHPVGEFVNDNRMTLLTYYKTLKALTSVDSAALAEITSQAFISETLQIMRRDASNNILHNHQR